MRRVVALVPLFFVVGCGGAGALLGFSPFEGSWTGTWAGGVADGPATMNIDALGAVSGNMHSDAANKDGPVAGQILNNGTATITVTFEGEAPVVGDGVLVKSSGGTRLSGTLDFQGDNIFFDLSNL